jgi:hypothetical protein
MLYLSEVGLENAQEVLTRGSEISKCETSFGNAGRRADLIERECGVQYASHVWKALKKLG